MRGKDRFYFVTILGVVLFAFISVLCFREAYTVVSFRLSIAEQKLKELQTRVADYVEVTDRLLREKETYNYNKVTIRTEVLFDDEGNLITITQQPLVVTLKDDGMLLYTTINTSSNYESIIVEGDGVYVERSESNCIVLRYKFNEDVDYCDAVEEVCSSIEDTTIYFEDWGITFNLIASNPKPTNVIQDSVHWYLGQRRDILSATINSLFEEIE